MGADKGKKQKIGEKGEDEPINTNNSEHIIDGDLVLSVEKLQEIQDELEKVFSFFPVFFYKMFYDLMVLISSLHQETRKKLFLLFFQRLV